MDLDFGQPKKLVHHYKKSKRKNFTKVKKKKKFTNMSMNSSTL